MENNKVYVGLDLHRETVHGTALDKEGNIICSHRFPSTKEALREFFKTFEIWNTSIAMEACGMWRGCYNILQELGFSNTKLANPYKCQKINPEKKTDKTDSKLLANLLRTNYLPEVFIPSKETLELRDLSRHRSNIVDERTRIQHQIKHYLIREGITYGSIWNKKGIVWLKSLDKKQLADLTEIYEKLCEKEKSVEKIIELKARGKIETSLLMTIPGIGIVGAMMIYSEIGDISRFPTAKHLHAYAGLAPGIYQSADTSINLPRKNVNKWLKWILTECAGIAIRKPNQFQKHYFAIEKKKGWKIARKSTARHLLTVAWHILKENVPYKES